MSVVYLVIVSRVRLLWWMLVATAAMECLVGLFICMSSLSLCVFVCWLVVVVVVFLLARSSTLSFFGSI